MAAGALQARKGCSAPNCPSMRGRPSAGRCVYRPCGSPSGSCPSLSLAMPRTARMSSPFGGAYAVLAFMARQRVETYGWLRPGEMLDGLGMAETTPGPLIMVVQFVGFLAAFRHPGLLPPMLAGTLGGLLATWCTFVPCFLWIGLGAPFIERLRDNKALTGALAGITAAVVGVILNLAIWFALHTWFRDTFPLRGYGVGFDMPVLASLSPWALALSVAALVAILRFKAGTMQTLAAASAAGIVLYLAGLVMP